MIKVISGKPFPSTKFEGGIGIGWRNAEQHLEAVGIGDLAVYLNGDRPVTVVVATGQEGRELAEWCRYLRSGAVRVGEDRVKMRHAMLDAVSAHFAVSISELAGKSRKRHVTEARHVAAFLLRVVSEFSLKEVGFALGGRDHSTILHSVGVIKGRLGDFSEHLREIQVDYQARMRAA